jgi:TP901 family phage tail tape measure protein
MGRMTGSELPISVPIRGEDSLSPVLLREIATLQQFAGAATAVNAPLAAMQTQANQTAAAVAALGREQVRTAQAAAREATTAAQSSGRQEVTAFQRAVRLAPGPQTREVARQELEEARERARVLVQTAQETGRRQVEIARETARQRVTAAREAEGTQGRASAAGGQLLGGAARGVLSEAVGGGLLLGAGLGVAGVAAAATREAAQQARAAMQEFRALDAALRETNSLLGLTGTASRESFREISGDVRRVSQQLGIDLTQTAREAYQALSSSVPREDLGAFLQAAGRAALGGATDIKSAGDVISATANQFQIPFSEAERVSNALFVTIRTGRTTMEELSRSLFQLGPTAAAAGISLEETLAAVATLTSRGVPAAEAMTRIRASIDAIQRPSAEAAQLQQLLGVQVDANTLRTVGYKAALDTLFTATQGNTAQLTRLLGSTEGYQAAVVLAGSGSRQFAANLREQQEGAQATQRAVDEMSLAANRSFTLLNANIQAARQNFGQLSTGQLAALAETFNNLGASLGAWPSNVPPSEQIERMRALGGAAETTYRFFALLAKFDIPLVGLRAVIDLARTVAGGFDQNTAATRGFAAAQGALDNLLATGAITQREYTQRLAELRQQLRSVAPDAYQAGRAVSEEDETRRANLQGRAAQTRAIIAAEIAAADASKQAAAATDQWDAAAGRFAQQFALADAAKAQQTTADAASEAVQANQRRIQDIRDALAPLQRELQETMQAPIEGATRLQAALAGVNQQISRSDLVVAQVRLEQIRARIAGEAPPSIDREALMQAAMDKALASAQRDVITAQQGVSVTPYETLRGLATAPPELPGPVAVARAGQLSGQVRAGEAAALAAQPGLLALQRAADAAAIQSRDAQRVATAYQDAFSRQQQLLAALGQRPGEGNAITPEQAGQAAAEAARAQIASAQRGQGQLLLPSTSGTGPAAWQGQRPGGAGSFASTPLLPPTMTFNFGDFNFPQSGLSAEQIKAIAKEQSDAAIDKFVDEGLAQAPGPAAAPTLAGSKR